MLEFKFDTKISDFQDIATVLRVINERDSTELQAAEPGQSSPRLIEAKALDNALQVAGIALPSDPSRAWRSHWNEVVMYGVVYWDYSQMPGKLALTPAGEEILDGADIQDVLIRTFGRLQYPHPLKTPASNLAPFIEAKARIVPVRRAARALVELEARSKAGSIAEAEVYLSDSELYYIWSCPDWSSLPDGDVMTGVERILLHRKGKTIPHQPLMTAADSEHWLIRLPVRISQLHKYFTRTSNPKGISLAPGVSNNPIFVSALLANTDYFNWIERTARFESTKVTLPTMIYSAWGLYHGGTNGSEYLAYERDVFASSPRTVATPAINDREDYSFTKNLKTWHTPLSVPSISNKVEFIESWIKKHWHEYSFTFETLAIGLDAIQHGHVLLQGPPGTGKTQFAQLLADILPAHLIVATATPDWSTVDTIGGISLSETSAFKAEPRNGIVTEAILDCARSVSGFPTRLVPSNATMQPVWLMIDEFNRAEIDKVFGGLFTALSSTDPQVLNLPFQTNELRSQIGIPRVFRIIATANTMDKAYVNGMSQALLRRFSVVEVGPPAPPDSKWDLSHELERLSDPLFGDFCREAGSLSHEALIASKRSAHVDIPDPARIAAMTKIYDAVRVLRYGGKAATKNTPTVPIGTAQVIDATVAASRMISQGDSVEDAASKAIIIRLLPQVDFLPRSQLERLTAAFRDEGDSHSAAELERMATRLPQLL